MAKKNNEFMGNGNTLDTAIANMYSKATETGLTVDGSNLPVVGYTVGIAKTDENQVFGEEQKSYDAALTSALGWARIPQVEYANNNSMYDLIVKVRGEYHAEAKAKAEPVKGRPSGAAPIAPRAHGDVSDLF